MINLLWKVTNLLRFNREPTTWIALGFIVLFTVFKVYGPADMMWTEVFSNEYATYIGALLTAILTRGKVMSPDTHKKRLEAALVRTQDLREGRR